VQYVMEKSSGNGSYAALDSIPSKKKPGKTSYSLDLRTSTIRGNFIRLKSVDNQGRTVYSNTLYIRPASEMMRIFPNPSNSIIKIGSLKEPPSEVLLLNPIGQLIKASSWVRENQLEIDVRTLQPGSYSLVLDIEGKKRIFPFMKQ